METVKERALTVEEARAAGHDVGEIQEFPIMRLEISDETDGQARAYLDYELGGFGIWILELTTQPQFRRQGLASRLLEALYGKARELDRAIFPGLFTEEGEQYLRPVVNRLDEKYPKVEFIG